ncbi:hypothetical protein TrVE_jg6406 [Triparma verrucosa]|uniref:Uncharacterized protein n=1 Tax=Triparma verrucosa TaxID=1606542 RepID=A0A9W7CFP0_9STRA|nr:hypothetical protein TrVE_jg6406 [Triparma verrucosa]
MPSYDLWHSKLSEDCFDGYELVGCEILEEGERVRREEGEIWKVKFKASMRVKGEKKVGGFLEESTFVREEVDGEMGWFYQHGEVEAL